MASSAALPDWPRRMGAELAAAYLGISQTTLRKGALKGTHPKPINDGKRVLWDRKVLDQWADIQGNPDKPLEGWG